MWFNWRVTFDYCFCADSQILFCFVFFQWSRCLSAEQCILFNERLDTTLFLLFFLCSCIHQSDTTIFVYVCEFPNFAIFIALLNASNFLCSFSLDSFFCCLVFICRIHFNLSLYSKWATLQKFHAMLVLHG